MAAVDPQTNEILLDSDPGQLGMKSPQYDDFQPLVVSSSWWNKLQVLLRSGKRYYQLENPLGTRLKPLLYVRVVIAPALIRRDINPALKRLAVRWLPLMILAVCLMFLLSISLLCFRK